jgi:hypothetical protein
MMLGDSTLESLTPSVNTTLVSTIIGSFLNFQNLFKPLLGQGQEQWFQSLHWWQSKAISDL